MLDVFDYLREFHPLSVFFRLALAMFFGGIIGLERGRKRRAAGFRTYMLVSLGAALTMLLGQYEHLMLSGPWAAGGRSVDVARFGAQVINGIGFLGAGTVIVTSKQQVKGLTTAAGLWASACMGLATGAGFYECVILAFLLVLLVVRVLPVLEAYIVSSTKNVNIYMEFDSLDHIGRIINCIKSQGAHIYEVEIDRGRDDQVRRPSAVFFIRLNERQTHTKLMLSLSEIDAVRLIEEI